MPELIANLSTRRAYEHPTDSIRLTMLSHGNVIEHLSDLFKFQAAEVGTPPALFGPVPQTNPPGLIFMQGVVSVSGDQVIPIRSITVESRRIVVDVAGPSKAIDTVYAMLLATLDGFNAPDGHPVIGETTAIKNYSDITFRAQSSGLLASLISNRLLREVERSAVSSNLFDEFVLVPSVRLHCQRPNSEYPGVGFSTDSFTLDLRAGTGPDDNILHSSAPLDSDSHWDMLVRLDAR